MNTHTQCVFVLESIYVDRKIERKWQAEREIEGESNEET